VHAFTISEVAADWHELMMPQRTMRPSIARMDLRFAASRHTTTPVSNTMGIPVFRIDARITIVCNDIRR